MRKCVSIKAMMNPITTIGRCLPYMTMCGKFADTGDDCPSATLQRNAQGWETGAVLGGTVNHTSGVHIWTCGHLTTSRMMGPSMLPQTPRQMSNYTTFLNH
jgi:hypothetical protein